VNAAPGEHGGPDALGQPRHDFSTNANACGPCPQVLAAVNAADAAHYPDPLYTALRERLAAFHGVDAERIHLAASASEFIMRMTAVAARLGGQGVYFPQPGYADYARAAQAHGLHRAPAAQASLLWHADPDSPRGRTLAAPPLRRGAIGVLDMAYAPLRLQGDAVQDALYWRLWTPNKALGLTGVRAAYALAPAVERDDAVAPQLEALMPSWPIGAHGVAMLHHWTLESTQHWLRDCLPVLREWKARQIATCESLGWACLPSDASFFCAAPSTQDLPALLAYLRSAHGIKLRDATSLGLPGFVRLNVLSPASQDALREALLHRP